ncbi:basic helix-loop-helix protein [Coemansia sp. RSA 2559]|nr:basic helix-loop-helix protein [Coemansia sp. RSA 2559]KAJ2861679.1 basic helix-loop-helix protein [Coemansia erecta]
MSAKGSSSVLLSVEDKDTIKSSHKGSGQKYATIAPKSPETSNGSAEAESDSPNGRTAGLAAIAPAIESRIDGTPLMSSFAVTDMMTPTPKRKQRAAKEDQPTPGTDEWHRLRRDSHKEVERRRREVINQGIDQLADLIPGAEKNKGKIIAQAVEYVTRLRANEEKNIEKWTIEKLLADQAIAELTAQVDQLKSENKKLKSKLSKNRNHNEEDETEAGFENEEGETNTHAEAIRMASKRRSPGGDEDAEMAVDGEEEDDEGAPPEHSSSHKKSSKSSGKKKSHTKKRKSSSSNNNNKSS